MSADFDKQSDDLTRASVQSKSRARQQSESITDDNSFDAASAEAKATQLTENRRESAPLTKTAESEAFPASTFYDAPTEVMQHEPRFAKQNIKAEEEALKPSRLRVFLVCLAFTFALSWSAVDIQQIFSKQSNTGDWSYNWQNQRLLIVAVGWTLSDKLKINDEILAVNNVSIDKNNKSRLTEILWRFKPGETYALSVKRGDDVRSVEIVAAPLSIAALFNQSAAGIFAPLAFYLVGALIFFFKPNNKQTVLLSLAFAALGIMVAPKLGTYDIQLSPLAAFLWRSGIVVVHLAFPLFLHFHLLFPERLRIVRRFPQIERLIYLPFLFYVVPVIAMWQLSSAGWTQFDALEDREIIGGLANLLILLSLSAALLSLLLNYLQTNETGKRRLRILGVGVFLSMTPNLFNYAAASIDPLSNIKVPYFGAWQELVFSLPTILLPFLYAYAIVRHKVLPISFIVRRGLQYLLAKNALRFLLVLPVLGIGWNVFANPDRTLSEIFFNNTTAFYTQIFLAVTSGLLIRFRLNDWVDRSFFRTQYDQERILRDLIEAVRDSDSVAKLSRLICSKIELSLHPKSIYLFFQNSQRNDFSLEYSTSEKSQNLKFAVDSPLLNSMQLNPKAVDISSPKLIHLPAREREWLENIEANLLVPMIGTNGLLTGFFSLGEKKSEIPYTNRDQNLLETLAQQIAFVYENLTLKDQMRREQTIKTQVLSRFEAGNINLLKECPVCGKCFDRIFEHCDDDGAELTFTLPVMRTIENRYRLEKLVGKGGMGTVYEAIDLRLNRAVAVKVLGGASFGNNHALRRFEREAQTVARLQHPNIVTVFDYGVLSTEGAFLVMELVRGKSLASTLKRAGKINPKIAVGWFEQILDGVEAAHQAAIIHRDLKPQNILVSKNEANETRLCILDFGLARMHEQNNVAGDSFTVPGTILGTFGYMPLEQLRGEKTDARSDLFAVGAMIYEALHGKLPFRGGNYHELLQSMNNNVVSDSDTHCPEFFERALARAPEQRFASAAEMKNALLKLIL